MARMRATLSTLSAAALLALAACEGSESSTPVGPKVPAEGDAVIFQRILDGELTRRGAPPDRAVGRAADRDERGLRLRDPRRGTRPLHALVLQRALPGHGGPRRPRRGVGPRPGRRAGRRPLRLGVRLPGGGARPALAARPLRGAEPALRAREPDPARQARRTARRALARVGDAKTTRRTLRVWVPAEPPTHFMYAHDGQNLFGMVQPFGSCGCTRRPGPPRWWWGSTTPRTGWPSTPASPTSEGRAGGATTTPTSWRTR